MMDQMNRAAASATPANSVGPHAETPRTAHPVVGQPAAPRSADLRPATGQPVPAKLSVPSPASAFVRAENEDDDGYDPYSDRPARPEPLFESDPWR